MHSLGTKGASELLEVKFGYLKKIASHESTCLPAQAWVESKFQTFLDLQFSPPAVLQSLDLQGYLVPY